ncbi:MAG TPA: sigma-70 family RNA polymerase sigma factor [Kofleriaceae bacterium]|nr:sigma-70 family RNA polymerase sigma factor [Kofleriaceae bacterium]
MTAESARPAESQDDLELARRSAGGDIAAQRQLFRDQRGRVHRTLYRILGSNADMEDLVQDVFLEVFRSLDRYRGEARLSTWIARITARVAMHYFGRRKPPSYSLDALPFEVEAAGPSAEQVALAREAARRLYRALDRVEAAQRVAFALHVIDGIPLREVADITESSLVATKSRVWRARREIEKRARRDPLLAGFLAHAGADADADAEQEETS